MQFETFGDKQKPAILFFHAMGVTGSSSRPVARHLQISDPAGFANMLVSIMKQDSLPELPFVRKGEYSDEI